MAQMHKRQLYTPDFYLTRQRQFREIKGFISPESAKKYKRFVVHFGCELDVLREAELRVLGVLTAKGKVVLPHVR